MSEGVCSSGTFTYRKNKVVSDMNIGYCGVFDGEVDKCSWDKQTIDWAIANEKKIKNFVRGQICRYSDSSYEDAEEIFQSLMLDLYKAEDFLVGGEQEGLASTVQNYVFKRAEYLVRTFKEKMCDVRRSRKDSQVKDEDGEFIEIFDLIASENNDYEGVIYSDVESFLIPLEPRRYEFGFDLFQMLYISVLGNRYNLNNEGCFKVLALLNDMDMTSVKEAYLKLRDDEEIMSVVLAVNNCRDIKPLEQRVYAVEQIQNILAKIASGK